jgi:hypothetical protein
MANYNDFLKWVDIPKFADACHNICHQTILNESTNRMMKEKFIIAAMQLSNHAKNIDWTDERDFDVKFTAWTDGEVEVKTGNEPMFSAKTGKPKKQISLKLKNVYESKNQRTELDKEFDHLMIIQIKGTFAIAFVDYATVKANLKQLTDGFLVKLTHDQVNIVYEKDMRNEGTAWTIDLDPKTWVIAQLTKAGL